MKISIKTIKGELFTVEIESNNTILELKKKIEEVKGIEVSTQKLILKGTNTTDEKTLTDYGVKEGDFLVVMQTKKLPSSAAQPQPQPQAQAQPQPQPQQKPAPPPSSQAPPSSSIPAPAQSFDQESASSVLMGDKLEKTIDEICAMGFGREEAKKALRAAFNNPDRAIEYLINGIPNIPEERPPHHPPQAGAGASASAGLGGLGAGSLGSSISSEQLIALLNAPQFIQLRNMIRQNPQVLPPLLQQLQQTQPEFYNAITQNQEAFTRWLMEGGEGGAGGAGGVGGIGGIGGAGGAGGAGGQHVIHVTQEEKEAIDRLVALGFDRQQVIQAYLVCDKDENLAANYLFENAAQVEQEELEYLQSQSQPQPPSHHQVQSQGQPLVGGQANPVNVPKPEGDGGKEEAKEEDKKEGKDEGKDEGGKKKDKDDDDDTIFS